MNDGTFSIVTDSAWPPVTATRQTTRPAGVSRRMVVTGSVT